jgi:hypothetical protein
MRKCFLSTHHSSYTVHCVGAGSLWPLDPPRVRQTDPWLVITQSDIAAQRNHF